LPPALVAQLDLSTLTPVPGSFVSPGEQGRHADVLLSVQARDGGGEVLVYVLVEHQSTTDEWMVLRVLRYMVRIWERWLKAHPKAHALPPVVPVVVSHAPGGWRAPVAFEEVLGVDGPTLEALRPHVPLFRMVLDDLTAASDQELHARAMTAMGKLALGLLKHARRFDVLLDEMRYWGDALGEVLEAQHGLGAQAAVLRYIHLVNDRVAPDEVARRLEQLLGPASKEAYVTYGELLIQQGIERGIEQGIEQGIERGERQVLVRQLTRRFGPLPDHAAQRIEAAGRAELELWADRVLTAPSLDEVLAG
jgi:hypothetical protein